MIWFLLKILLISLSCTLIIEVLTALALKVRDKKDIINVVLVNILTNPLLVSLSLYINLEFGLKWRKILIIPMEIIVVLVEGLIYKKYLKYNKINPIILSLIPNAMSYIIGIFINMIIY